MQQADQYQTFSGHLKELRRRSIWIGVALVAGGVAGFVFNTQIQGIIIKPLGQTLYYTSPAGGLSFSIQICFLVGMLAAAPVMIYQLLRFAQPVSVKITSRLMLVVLPSSLLLAAMGIAFAYFVSLPSALRFLTNFGSESIHALITVNEYMTFVIAYLAGCALIFQLPLVFLLINRIRPLPPKSLARLQKPVIIGSFIAAAILTPTPDPINQLIMVAPIILLFEFSCILVLASNHAKNKKPVETITLIEPAIGKTIIVEENMELVVAQGSNKPLVSRQYTKKRVLTIDGFLAANQVSDMLSVDKSGLRNKHKSVVSNQEQHPKSARIIDIWPSNLYYKEHVSSV